MADLDVEAIARKKHKFDDNAYLEESREINDNVRSAVSAGELTDTFPSSEANEQVCSRRRRRRLRLEQKPALRRKPSRLLPPGLRQSKRTR